jgi:hypothetical protein
VRPQPAGLPGTSLLTKLQLTEIGIPLPRHTLLQAPPPFRIPTSLRQAQPGVAAVGREAGAVVRGAAGAVDGAGAVPAGIGDGVGAGVGVAAAGDGVAVGDLAGDGAGEVGA